jgi:peroxiredoxin
MRALALALLLLAPQEKAPPTLTLGSPAPDFDVPGVDGKRYALKDFAGKKLLLVLFDTVHCPTSQAYEERIKKVAADYQEKGVGVISISPNHPKAVRLDELGYTDLDDSFESMKIRARDHKFNFPFCFDGEPNAVSQAYGPKATPHAFIFDAERKLRYQGGIDDSEFLERVKVNHLRNALDALLEGKEPPANNTRVFGCSTKWPNKQPSAAEYHQRIAAEPVAVETVTAEQLKEARQAQGKVRLFQVFSTADASQLQAAITMYHMYRRRNFQFVPVAVEGEDKKDAVLAALKGDPPAGKNRNLMLADLGKVRETLDAEWDGKLPYTLVLGSTGDALYRKAGAIDELACRRAVVRNLADDRRPPTSK